MNKIDISGWKEFKLVDLFDIKRPDARVATNYDEGEIPFVASGNFNNGIEKYVSAQKENEKIDKGNCITISPVDGSAFYQKLDFFGRGGAGSSILLLYNQNLNESNAIFLCSVIRKICSKYNYSNMCSANKLKTEKLLLPATPAGSPDWQFMEDFINNLYNGDEIQQALNLPKTEKKAIDISTWKEFKLVDLFEQLDLKFLPKRKFNKATDVSLLRTTEFDLPLVNAKHNNNGIMYYGRSSDFESTEMTIDIVADGAASTGDVYPQPQRTGVLYNAYLVKPLHEVSKFVLFFLSTIVQNTVKKNFGYDNKCTWDKVKHHKILLPATPSGSPDWQFMENYIKSLPYSCYL